MQDLALGVAKAWPGRLQKGGDAVLQVEMPLVLDAPRDGRLFDPLAGSELVDLRGTDQGHGHEDDRPGEQTEVGQQRRAQHVSSDAFGLEAKVEHQSAYFRGSRVDLFCLLPR